MREAWRLTTATERLTRLWEDSPGLWGWLTTVDHKRIGHRYLVTALLFLVVGGVEAVLIRQQLARPEQRLLTPEVYKQIFSMHSITVIFWYVSPILTGFGNYLVLLLIGARDICPSSTSGKEFVPTAFSPRTGFLCIPAHNTCMDYEGIEANYIAGTPYLGASVKMYPGPCGCQGELVARDVAQACKV
jgi:hypothetical protein